MSDTEKKDTRVHLEDCRRLAPTELRKRYPAEANTHRNVLQRAKNQGRIVHPDFRKFRDFLAHVGPRPCAGATLDRIDNLDPEYAPGKVRWADKRTQNSNKGDTLLLYYSRTGDTYTVDRLARLRKLSPSTIRKRRERGWTDDEIIEGKRHTAPVVIHSSHHAHDRPRYSARPEIRARPQPTSGADILFERNRRFIERCREENGEEPCWEDFETARKECAEGPNGFFLTQENFERRWLEDFWKPHAPHLFIERMPQWAQELIRKIDPDGAAAAYERAKVRAAQAAAPPSMPITDESKCN
jgi:hypothetical protein